MITQILNAISEYWPEIELILYALQNRIVSRERLKKVVEDLMTEASDQEMHRTTGQ